MGISLQKGQKADITKGRQGISALKVGLGWDAATQKKANNDESLQTGKGILGKVGGVFKGAGNMVKNALPIDCDASVFLLNEGGRLDKASNVVYFGNKRSGCGSVIHQGDNTTGKGEGDDETINVTLNKIPNDIHRLVFVVNIYQANMRKQHFGLINNAYIRIVDEGTNEEVIRFNLSSDYMDKTALIAGEIYRHNGEWKFNALGEGTLDKSLDEMKRRY